jgi:hypothetical protein
MDVVSSWKYANKIIKYFNPKEIIIGTANNPYDFYENRIKPITNAGSEHLAFKIAAKNKSILIKEISNKINLYFKIILRFKSFYRFFREVYNFFYYSIFHYYLFIFFRLFLWKKKNKIINSRILFNCVSCNDYYYDQIKDDIFSLNNNGY